MNELLHDYLFPILLGSNTTCHACVRQFEKRYGIDSTVFTGKRALTLRFLPHVTLVHAPPRLADDILLQMLLDASDVSYGQIPLLVLCDDAYRGFTVRNRAALEAHFILREGVGLLEESAPT